MQAVIFMGIILPATLLHRMYRRLLILLALAWSHLPLAAQTPLIVPRVPEPVVLDGPSNEPAWASVEPWIPVQYEPENGLPATERTEFLVAYDEQYVYFALRAFDQDENGIRANTLYRDRLSGDDHFEILLDTFNDDETALLFTTTPAGIRKDAAISNDASGGGLATGGWINGDFNTYWDVATEVNSEGWFAEIRVPISSLRFQDVDGRAVMGITLQRKIARKTERVVYPPVPSIANWAFLKPSLARKILFEDLRSVRPIYITGYSLGGMEHDALPLQPGVTTSAYLADAGLDLKYGLSNNVTADLTLNTDFAQVEADDQQINLTRFSLFYPEKRQFFQERAGLFDFRVGSQSRLFHSRRIGLNESGETVRLLGGGRVVGRVGAWDFGLLNLQTGHSGDIGPENFGVMRLRHQLNDGQSRVGGMFTSRASSGGRYNLAYGLDGMFHIGGEDFLIVQWSQSFDDAIYPEGAFDNGRLAVAAERRRRRGVGYNSIIEWAGESYYPGVGFTQRLNYALVDHTSDYTWIGEADSPLIWHRIALRGFAFMDNESRQVETAEIGPEWDFSAKNGANGGIEVKWQTEQLTQPFFLSENVVIPKGRYRFFRVGADYSVSHTSLFQLRPSVESGTFYDGWQLSVGARPVWYISKHLELSASYRLTRIRFDSRDDTYIAHLGRLRIGTALNAKFSANAFIQLNSIQSVVSGNIRFRYNFREGNDLWLVYNANMNTDRDRVIPHQPQSLFDLHTLLLKYTHTLQF